MNLKRRYRDGVQPVFLHEVQIDGKPLIKGQHAQLAPLPGRKQNRDYEFCYAEMLHGQTEDMMLLVFTGPVRSTKRRYRYAHLHEVLKIRR